MKMKFYSLSGWDKVPLAIAGEAVAKCYSLATSKPGRDCYVGEWEEYKIVFPLGKSDRCQVYYKGVFIGTLGWIDVKEIVGRDDF